MENLTENLEKVTLKVNCCIVCKKETAEGGKPLKQCSLCHRVYYCSQNCQKQDWKTHKPVCKDADKCIQEYMKAKTLAYNDFETIKKLGDGNFTKVF